MNLINFKMTNKLIKDFRYKGRRCVVVEMLSNIPKILSYRVLKPYCNGYVEVKDKEAVIIELTKKNNGSGFLKMINSAEITYEGDLSNLDLSDGHFYIGFDSAHAWNDAKPESKKADYVEETCRKIVDELNEYFTRCK
jgi:hypothetical protein